MHELIDRLLLVRRLLDRASEGSNTEDPINVASAILNLQDAAEVLLGTICTHLRLAVRDDAGFFQYLRSIHQHLEKSGGGLLYQRELSSLNNIRVRIKHYGDIPSPNQHRETIQAAKDFLHYATKKFFDLNLSELNSAERLRNGAFRELFKKAERALRAGDRRSCAEALALIRHGIFIHTKVGGHDTARLMERVRKGLPAVEWDEYSLNRHGIALLEDGIDLSKFYRLCRILPETGIELHKLKVVIRWDGDFSHDANWTDSNLTWCLNALVEMALAQEARLRISIADLVERSTVVEHEIIVKRDQSPIYESPIELLRNGRAKGKSPRVLMRLAKGTILKGWTTFDEELQKYDVFLAEIPHRKDYIRGHGIMNAADIEVREIPLGAGSSVERAKG